MKQKTIENTGNDVNRKSGCFCQKKIKPKMSFNGFSSRVVILNLPALLF
jgi:hypothetical protein